MDDRRCVLSDLAAPGPRQGAAGSQTILVFQQNGGGSSKIQGIIRFGDGLFNLQTVSIDVALPAVIDDSEAYLPRDIQADLVLDFLQHPDLSEDLAALCCSRGIAVVASGKKLRVKGALTPPT
jgi:thymidylate synthase